MTDKSNEVPDGLNLRDTNFKISRKAKDLAEKCLESLKDNVFFCSTMKRDTTYIQCFKCPNVESCSLFSEIEKDASIFEFYLDIEETEVQVKEKRKKKKKKDEQEGPEDIK